MFSDLKFSLFPFGRVWFFETFKFFLLCCKIALQGNAPHKSPRRDALALVCGVARYRAKMVQHGQDWHFGRNHLIPKWSLAFVGWVHFGLYWPARVHFGTYGSTNCTVEGMAQTRPRLSGPLRLRLQSRSRMRLRIAASIAFFVSRLF